MMLEVSQRCMGVCPGESNVYTTGYIGQRKVVSTKLPAIGHYRAAQISSGNITTRLLGTHCVTSLVQPYGLCVCEACPDVFSFLLL